MVARQWTLWPKVTLYRCTRHSIGLIHYAQLADKDLSTHILCKKLQYGLLLKLNHKLS